MLNKVRYLQEVYTEKLRMLNPFEKPRWGKMNPAQMVDHMIYSFQLANGKIKVDQLITKEDHIPKMQEWLIGPKSMKENFVNPLIPLDPPEPFNEDFEESISALQNEIEDMLDFFAKRPGIKLLNPFFGELDYNLYVNLLYKHALHHLRQFGIEEEYIED